MRWPSVSSTVETYAFNDYKMIPMLIAIVLCCCANPWSAIFDILLQMACRRTTGTSPVEEEAIFLYSSTFFLGRRFEKLSLIFH